jgi:hypothetical protein
MSTEADTLIPLIKLIVTPSAYKVLGRKKTWQFIKDWRGDSKVGDMVVVKYSVFGM